MSRTANKYNAVLGVAAMLGGLATLMYAAPAKAAVTEVAYQRVFDLTCGGSACHVSLPMVAANTQLNLHRVSCYLSSTQPAEASWLSYNSLTLAQYMAPIMVSPWISLFNQEMDVLLLPQKAAEIDLYFGTGGTGSATCTLTGVLRKFS